jgi:hypothetical protein
MTSLPGCSALLKMCRGSSIERLQMLLKSGSSSTLTLSMYRSALTKQRTLELLQYLREMPGPSAP